MNERGIKKDMKRMLAISAVVFLSLSTAGCGKESAEKSQGSKAQAVGVSESKKSYEVVFKKAITVDGDRKKLKIAQNTENVSDLVMKVDGEEVKLKRVSIGAGYVHAEGKAADVTGDGKEEMILLLHGGASGASLEIQVLGQTDKGWEEIALPDELWEDDNKVVVLDQQAKSLDIRVDATNTSKTIKLSPKQEGADAEIRYRGCKLKGNQIVIQNDVVLDGRPNPVATVSQEVVYDKESGKFQYGKTQID